MSARRWRGIAERAAGLSYIDYDAAVDPDRAAGSAAAQPEADIDVEAIAAGAGRAHRQVEARCVGEPVGGMAARVAAARQDEPVGRRGRQDDAQRAGLGDRIAGGGRDGKGHGPALPGAQVEPVGEGDPVSGRRRRGRGRDEQNDKA